ncbi:MAG: SH3 domain-containing protein [Terriglobia bacterium]
MRHARFSGFPILIVPVVAAVVTISCGTGNAPRAPVIGEAYAGPPTLALHAEIDAKSKVVAIVHHGDKLQIISHRRRWYKVRGPKGGEGWTDDRALLDLAQMNRLKTLAKETAGLPSQGVGTTFDTLKVHAEPNRNAISFLEIKEGEKFDLLAHRVLTRGPLPKRELIPPRRKAQKTPKKGKALAIPPPPPPRPPGPPKDWVALSKALTVAPDDQLTPAAKDDWSLIRTRDGQGGWVLTSRIYLAIPDEVAQYAEGHRITSYFSLGKITDGDLKKDIWLWTTSVTLGEDHDFDSYRVFVWSLRHHRYETAYIQRREVGYFPVLAKTGEFSVCLENDAGVRVRKMYTMLGNAVRQAGEKACEPSFDVAVGGQLDGAPQIVVNEGQAPAVKTGIVDRLKARVKGWLGK